MCVREREREREREGASVCVFTLKKQVKMLFVTSYLALKPGIDSHLTLIQRPNVRSTLIQC